MPGTLLNMALLNLGSPELALRVASYNFLSALTVTFRFDIGGAVMEAQVNPRARSFTMDVKMKEIF